MEHGGHEPSITELGWPLVNFLLFVGLLVWQLRGPIREFFRARTERLRDELAAGEQARKEAEALRARLAKDLADLPATRDRLKADLLATAGRERDQMIAQGKETAERIRNDAKLLAAQELATARRALRQELVGDVVREAGRLVQGALAPQDQERFVREFVDAARSAS
ncbi:MAG TPA: ATP synthase F0 subunit B [Candidatus Eisenbacteria bacterium]|nr:ATP synthase F0 subunit B [Candidatus Eisenbacteria bacterium]